MTSARLTIADCETFVREKTFRLRPPEYANRYPKWPGAVGIEVEMLPVRANPTDHEKPVVLQGVRETSAAILSELAGEQGWQIRKTPADNGEELVIGITLDAGDQITFEPGGQIEFSSIPYPCLSDAIRRTQKIQGLIDEKFRKHGIDIVQAGINPWHTLDQLGLQMPKDRYRAMDQYYRTVGEYGVRMMRQTCTTQVNLDFGPDEQTLAKRYVAAMLLSPIAVATFANSRYVDGKDTGVPCFRSRIWRHADPTHTGIPGLLQCVQSMTAETCVTTFLQYALDAHVVFVEKAGYKVLSSPMSFRQWLDQPIDGVWPDLKDWETHLSLMFTEVRPRGFLELRSIDCQSRVFQAVPAYYYAGLIYNDQVLDRVLEYLIPSADSINGLLIEAEFGFQNAKLLQMSQHVMELACEGFSGLPDCFKEDCSEEVLRAFKTMFTDQGKNPADVICEKMQGREPPLNTDLLAIEKQWREDVERFCFGS